MHGFVQIDACNCGDGGGGLGLRVGVIYSSNVGRRLKKDIGHVILKKCSWVSSYDSKKDGYYVIAKGGGCLKSGIYNFIKYGLMGMRHKNANLYVVRK